MPLKQKLERRAPFPIIRDAYVMLYYNLQFQLVNYVSCFMLHMKTFELSRFFNDTSYSRQCFKQFNCQLNKDPGSAYKLYEYFIIN